MPKQISTEWRCIDCGAQLTAAHVKRCRSCFAKFRIGSTRPLKHPGSFRENGKTYFWRSCDSCGGPVKVANGNAHVQQQFFCSSECRGEAMSKRWNQRPEIACLGCGATFRVPQAWIRRGGGRFCSKSCYRRYSGETGPESIARKCLDALAISFHQEHPIGGFRVDFFIPSGPTALEIDSVYWHEHESEKDKRRDAWMIRHGINVVRIDGDDLKRIRSFDQQVALVAARLHREHPNSPDQRH